MQYPIEITEHPHQGKPQTWTLWDYAHLMRCIEATRGKFEEWSDGAAIYCPENFIDFLRRDLKQIEAKEVE